ncbi:MAG TPA: hypothetical protein VIN59_09520, partial [Alphaproteobacteria bacterium]
GYTIQGLPILDKWTDLAIPGDRLIVETDKRLIPLFQRSYQNEMVEFIPTDPAQRDPLPNNGKPQTEAEMSAYFTSNARRLATRMGIAHSYAWARLLRPEIAPPFNSISPVKVPDPRPGYLEPDTKEVTKWDRFYNNEEDAPIPVLITWNKIFSQHSDAAQQNLDADDVAYIIKGIAHESPLRLAFYNAVHGITAADLDSVNERLPYGLRLEPIIDPKTNDAFNLGTELDRYAAFMSMAKANGGIMLGVGNTYQHLWYAIRADWGSDVSGDPSSGLPIKAGTISTHELPKNQIVVLPNGDFPTKPTWELQAAQTNSPTITVSKYSDFDRNRADSLANIVGHARRALKL